MRNFIYSLFNPYYNEKNYVSSGNFMKQSHEKHINCDQLQFFNDYSFEKEINRDTFELYKLFLQKIHALLAILKTSNSDLERALIVSYLFRNGFLSNNDNIINKELMFKYIKGINVLAGAKNDIAISRLYYDLFKYICNYPLEFFCYQYKNNNNFFAKHASANKVINLAMHEYTLYGIDLINNDLYTFDSEMKMHLISDIDENYLRYKPYDEIVTKYHTTISSIKDNQSIFKQNITENPISENEYDILKANVFNMLEQNADILHNFKQETKPIINEIKIKMLSKK